MAAAGVIAVAAWQFNQAAKAWQDAAGDEIRRASALEQCVRAMHAEALPIVGLAIAQPRPDGLRAVRTTAPVPEVESALAGEAVTRLRAGAAAGGTAVIDACRVDEAGLHPVTLIADGPDLSPGVTPEAIAAQGDRAAARGVGATTLSLAMVVIAVGVVARRSLSSRRRTAAGMTSVTASGPVVPPGTTSVQAHGALVAKLMAWGLLVTMPFVHLLDTAQERRCEALAAIQAVRLSTAAFVGSHIASSSPGSREAEVTAEIDALTGRLNASTNSESPTEQAVPAQEHTAAPPDMHLTAAAHRTAAQADVTQPGGTTVLDSEPTAWPALLEPVQGRTGGFLGSGTGIGFVLIGTLIAALVTMRAPVGGPRKWSAAALASAAVLALLGGLLLP